jgi:hypothetical protein
LARDFTSLVKLRLQESGAARGGLRMLDGLPDRRGGRQIAKVDALSGGKEVYRHVKVGSAVL